MRGARAPAGLERRGLVGSILMEEETEEKGIGEDPDV